MLADERIRTMSLAERGLLASMRWQSWVSDSVPIDPEKLARLLSAMAEEVRMTLSPAVLSFFEKVEIDSEHRFRNPELASYRQELERRRQQQRDAGKLGAQSRWGSEGTQSDGESDGERDGGRHGVLRREALSKAEVLKPGSREWIEQYKRAEKG